ncbi:response regulator [Paenibacillus sp. sptzw28]|uniref:response regulator transcription factor n=1 Tax=Paenibacillus sp. sptzw28 TaxID=715179 RepID=UPI001C6F459D|nr:response regulator [Paenibacillus sp. sptzw28]QYR19382.1 response regulator [Paenibacillus sp. sptzw28]
MYSLLIVDDEKWVRQGLRSSVDWLSEGIKVLGDAEDGEQALKMIEEETPDIIITDIRMPGMDGMDLLEWIQTRNLHTKVIMISGYSDFSYAHKALRYGACDYVLKPIEETLLLASVRKCVERLGNENIKHRQIEQMSHRIRESLPLARQLYLEKLLSGDKSSIGTIETMWEALNIDLNPARLKVICIQVYHWGSVIKEPKDRSIIRYALSNIAQELSLQAGKSLACPLDKFDCVDAVVIYSPSSQADIENDILLTDFLNKLIESARLYLGIGINIGISRERTGTMLPKSFQEAIWSGGYAFYFGYGKAYDASKLPAASDDSRLQRPYQGPAGWSVRFVQAIKAAKEDTLREVVEELIRHMAESSDSYQPLVLREGLIALLDEAALRVKESYLTVPDSNDAMRTRLSIPYCSLAQLQEELMAVLLPFRQAYCSLGNRKRVIELALTYIEAHYSEGISMNTVAEHLYINPSYFSKIFHEEMNVTFSKYLLWLRLKKAKKLLNETNLKIYEIAEQVGYNDFRHFAKMFKEQEGMTPAQYRNSGIQ